MCVIIKYNKSTNVCLLCVITKYNNSTKVCKIALDI